MDTPQTNSQMTAPTITKPATTMQDRIPLFIAGLALLLLPVIMPAIGLTVTSATEVVIFGIACMALNVLVGYTGLVSFGHGAWFGLAAYAAGLAQRHLFPGGFFLPLLFSLLFIIVISGLFGMLILRRRGVYFSLLTLALSAMLYVISFRWTAVTGGEDGLGGITRPSFAGFDLETRLNYYWVIAAIAFAVIWFLWRFHRSPAGQVLVAIRENETRAKFIGYATQHYKLLAFVISATITGMAGTLLLFNNRMTSADPIGVPFSGELIAMVASAACARSSAQRSARSSSSCSATISPASRKTGCCISACCSSASSCSRQPDSSAWRSRCSHRS
jgi:branched-chain amino acid transport system ATP-binding protein